MQKFLSSIMNKAGNVVEKIAAASRRKTAKPKRTGVTDTEGRDFGFIPWSEKQLQSLLAGAERKEIFSLLPALNGKKCLHLSPGPENYLEILVKRGAQDIIELDVSRASTSDSTQAPNLSSYPKARGSVEHLPLAEETFDFLMYPSALAWRSDLTMLIPEASRCLKDNGRILFTVIHPFFEYLMNPRNGFKKSIDTIFGTMRKNGFFLEELREGTLDEVIKTVSLPQKLTQDLQRYPGLPLVLAVKGIRLAKRKSK